MEDSASPIWLTNIVKQITKPSQYKQKTMQNLPYQTNFKLINEQNEQKKKKKNLYWN